MDSSNTLAILLGASAWPKSADTLPPSVAFSNSATGIRAYLLDPNGLMLPPSNLLDLFDNHATPTELLDLISVFLNERKSYAKSTSSPLPGDLLVYYTGHGGFTGPDKSYFLAVPTTKASAPGGSSLRMVDLAAVLRADALEMRRYIILDCCFSAAAYSDYQSSPAEAVRVQTLDLFPRRGTALFCSSNRRTVSIADDGKGNTMFSGALLDVLRRGDANKPDLLLSLEQIGTMTRSLILDKYPDGGVRPEVLSPDQSKGDVADVPFFPNAAHSITDWQAAYTRLAKRMQEFEQQTQTGKALDSVMVQSGSKLETEIRSGRLMKLTRLFSRSWPGLILLAVILTSAGASTMYFATRRDLNRAECRATNNLIATTYPIQLDQLKLQIDMADKEQQGLAPTEPKWLELHDLKRDLEKVKQYKTKELAKAQKAQEAQDDPCLLPTQSDPSRRQL